MMNGLFLTPLLFGLASAAQPAQDWTERALEVLELHGYFRRCHP